LADSFPALISYPEALQSLADNGSEPLRFYGGVLGRVTAGQEQAAFYLNLRAALIKGSILHTQGGVGVIAESEPVKELLEVRNKLSGLMKAVSAWECDT
jgi:isochorismate synthase EntC